MSYIVKEIKLPESKYSIKCPYTMTAEYITIHNTANDATAMNEVSYMHDNNNEVSYHFAIDDQEVINCLPLNRNGWHCGDGGNGTGNRLSIGVEICFSKSGGERYTKAEANTVDYVAKLLKERNWGVDRVKKHQDWSAKVCPHRILNEGRWTSFIQSIEDKLSNTVTTPPPSSPPPSDGTRYRVKLLNGNWLPWVNGTSDFAGIVGSKIDAIQIDGNTTYQVYANGNWYSWVTGYNTTNGSGYAGVYGKPIECIRIQNKTYRVSPLNSNYYPWVTHYNTTDGNGYAGAYTKVIDKLQIQ
jgi:N-acetylmuramoyl-L-alanine amidase